MTLIICETIEGKLRKEQNVKIANFKNEVEKIGYEIKEQDVGRFLAFHFGKVLSCDIGKMIYLKNGCLEMENNEQLQKRTK